MNESESMASFDTRAREQIYEFLRVEGEKRPREEIVPLLEGPMLEEHPNLGQIYIYKGELGEFRVSQSKCEVIAYSAPNSLTPTEAEEYARAFLRRHVEDFEERNFERTDVRMERPFWKEEWKEKPRAPYEVSIFPNWAEIHVNLDTRRAHYFNASNLRLVRTTRPEIDETSAKQLILRRFPEARDIELELMEYTTDGGKTVITIWNMFFRPDDDPESPLENHSINADTGEAVP